MTPTVAIRDGTMGVCRTGRQSEERLKADTLTGHALVGQFPVTRLHRSQPADRLIRSGELHVGLKDFDDNVPIGDALVSSELDVNFEIWTVLTDKGFSKS